MTQTQTRPEPRISTSAARHARFFLMLAAGLALAASLALLLIPAGSISTETDGQPGVTESVTLLAEHGPWVLILLAVPVVITLLPLLARGTARAILPLLSLVLLGGFVVLALFSIGMFYLPALGALMTGTIISLRHRPDSR
ncbi:hypothetical protein [Nesterenkonia ebinurensis]|uniref:hypothetical protein n=1 Tax=Nesterenkonia ebinurensis TaxID=2608252 RepID=UPI00123DF519|nr:hypothetical protein [Nesterenkonia ebinurensis]